MTAVEPPAGAGEPAPLPDAVSAVRALRASGRTLAVAESLTGGGVTDAIVAVAGASACLRGSVVAYATDVKATVLGVPHELLDRHGAVHPDVAIAMAGGVRAVLGADYGLATTGVAGPERQDGSAPGTFHVAVVGPWGAEVATTVPTPGAVASRGEVRAAARDAALRLLLRRASEDAAADG